MNDYDKANKKRIFLSPPYLNGSELDHIKSALASNYIAPLGPQVTEFEQRVAKIIGKRSALAVSSGTAAITLALQSIGVEPGDVVVASTLTFIGSVSPICLLGATPVFIDADNQTWNMDPILLEFAVNQLVRQGRRPRAIIPTDLYGQCADYDAIEAVGNVYNIPTILDSAEAMGATYKNRPAGNGGTASILSFNGNKLITTSGGGMLLSDDSKLIQRARKLASQAREDLPHYEHQEIGYNFRMSNILAAVGLGQLQDLDWRIRQKRKIFSYYRENLSSIAGITFMPEASYGYNSCWLSVCLIDPTEFGASREDIRLALESQNIESRPVWKPMHMQPVFDNFEVFEGAVSEKLFAQGLCLPSGLDLSNNDQDRIIEYILSCRRKS